MTNTSPQLELAKLGNAGGAAGDIAYWNGSAWVRLAKGSDGQFLTFDGTNVIPKWRNAGDSQLIAASGSAQFNVSAATVQLLSSYNIGGHSTAEDSGVEWRITFNFTSELAGNYPTVILGARNMAGVDVFCKTITPKNPGGGGSANVEFSIPHQSVSKRDSSLGYDAHWDFVIYAD